MNEIMKSINKKINNFDDGNNDDHNNDNDEFEDMYIEDDYLDQTEYVIKEEDEEDQMDNVKITNVYESWEIEGEPNDESATSM